jgi:DNA polymerase I-like protein with 3'-5' exonuclease and polymerase domains
MKLITLDFETYYSRELSLSKMTTESYIRDPQFEVIGVAVKVDDGKTVWASGSHEEIAEFLEQFEIENNALIAHNAAFDCAILNWRFGIKPKFIFDTLSMARPLHALTVGGSLAKLVEHYGLGAKGTEVVNAMGKRKTDFSPSELAAYAEYCINDVELTYQLLKKLSKGFPRVELQIIDMMVRMFTEPTLVIDRGVLDTHLTDIREKKAKLMAAIEAGTEDLMSNDKFAQALKGLGVEPPMKISLRTGKPAYAFAKTDTDFKALLEHPDEQVQNLVAARLGVKSTIEETRTESFIAISQRGTLPILLNYYGAHTGRASGGDKVNLQNLPRGGALRQSIAAPPGFVLVACDSSQIEARTVGWLAGQEDLTQAFAAGEDIYSLFASDVYGRPVNKHTDPQARHVGKTAILGLGYGMSAPKFQLTLKNGKPSMDLADAECKRVVDLYRRKYSRIPALWRQSQDLLIALYEGREHGLKDGLVTSTTDGRLRLPNGLYLNYPALSTEDGKNFSYKQRHEYIKVYGAKLVENITQALARIIVFDQMLAISKRYKVVLTVHDEVVILAPEDKADVAKAFMEEMMSTPPSWGIGLPISCEAGIGKNYGECK